MTKRRASLGLMAGVLSGLASASFALPASAADPVTGGTANIGTHPSYAGYTAFWRTGKDYSLLADDNSTYVNAPHKDGYVLLRGANSNWMHVSKRGAWLAGARFQNGWVSFGEWSESSQDAVATIGNHPSYGRGYAGFWLSTPNLATKHWDYSLLTDGGHSYLNAPDSDGTIYLRGGNVDIMTVDANSGIVLYKGRASKPGGGSWLALSDARVKKEVKPFELGLTELEKIRPVTFKYNGLAGTNASDQKFVGVVAQELERTVPFMVSTQAKKLNPADKETTNLKEVDPSAFTYLLINAVQELSQQNKQMAEENRQMKRILCKAHPTEALCKAQP
jgi:hypothetical protein